MQSDQCKYFLQAHQVLQEAIRSVQTLLRSYSEARPRLREMSELLLALFAKKNQAFFDALYAFYKDDRPSTKMIDFLVFDLKEAKIHYVTFFEKHSGDANDTHVRSFPKDFMDFSREMTGHMQRTEEYLFPLLEKMSGR